MRRLARLTIQSHSEVVNAPFDPWDESHRSDPKPLYAAMRETAPVYRGVGPQTRRSFWFSTRYDDVVASLRHPQLGREWQRLPEGLREQHEIEEPEALEASIVFESILERFPAMDFAIDPSDLEWSPGFFLRGVRRLPVST